MYEAPVGLWEYGRWVNGGHWTTCEARMIMAYYRLGQFEDADCGRQISQAERVGLFPVLAVFVAPLQDDVAASDRATGAGATRAARVPADRRR